MFSDSIKFPLKFADFVCAKISLLLIICIAFACNVCMARKQNRDIIDSLVRDLPNVKSDSQKIKNINTITVLYNSIDPAEGLKFAKQGVELSDKMGMKKTMAFSYNVIATNYETQCDYPNALLYFKKALALNQEGNFTEDIGVSKEYIGNVLTDECDFPNALRYYFDVVKISQKSNDNYNLARNYGNIAVIYDAIGDYTHAYNYNKRSLDMQAQFTDNYSKAIILLNLANVFYDDNKLDSAVIYCNKALNIFEDLGDKYGKSNALCNLAAIYKNLKNYSKAEEYADKSLEITSGIPGYRKSLYNALGNKGEIFLAMASDNQSAKANITKSIELLNKGVAGCREINDKLGVIEFSKYLAEAYKKEGNINKSLEYFEMYVDLKDSVFSPYVVKEIANIENSQNNIVAIKQFEIFNKSNNTKKSIIYTLFALVLILLGTLTYFILRNQRK